MKWWSKKISSLRKKQGKTQDEVGSVAGIDRHYLSGLENGHHVPRIDTLERVTKALNAKIEIVEK
jgi:transcriptional regulator with XRE-family HTH domain|tara:strand:- start:4477 stop:4671 length:195 start_codon:yes stop_codon:yes gene_type:complete